MELAAVWMDDVGISINSYVFASFEYKNKKKISNYRYKWKEKRLISLFFINFLLNNFAIRIKICTFGKKILKTD